MAPVLPSSTSSISLVPGCTFSTTKTKTKTKTGLIKCFDSKRSTERLISLSTSLRLFPHIRTSGSHSKPRFGVIFATGVEVVVDAPVDQVGQLDSPVSGQDSGQTSKPTSPVVKFKQKLRPVRKSEMPPLKDEDLVPDATFTGKVKSIQSFGAFVDFGAFTDGLVHVSQLSDGYVKDVSNVVSVGQEVKVTLVEANTETGRISLTMRENEPVTEAGRAKNAGQKSNSRRDREEGRKGTKFIIGQELEGSVKNLTRSGAFINLPEGEEGFLPASEEADEGFGSIMGDGSSLVVGQEVKVRVLRVGRGQVTLTMKKDDDNKNLDSRLQGKVYTATNPFLVAFRKNKYIASILKDQVKVEDDKVKPVIDEKVKDESVSEENGSIITEEQVEIPHVA